MRPPLYQIDQTLIDPPDGFAVSGQVITFSLAITNTGSDTITKFPLQDNFNPAQLTFQNAIPAVDLVTPGQLSWNDLTVIEGDLLPAATTNLLISFVVNQLPVTVTEIAIQAIGVGGELSDGTILPACRASPMVSLKSDPVSTPTLAPTSTPMPTPVPTSTSTPSKPPDTMPTPSDPPDRPTQPPPPSTTPTQAPPSSTTPTATPVLVTTPGPTTTVFPVALLPETGTREFHQEERGFSGGLLLLVLASLAVMYFLGKDNT